MFLKWLDRNEEWFFWTAMASLIYLVYAVVSAACVLIMWWLE